MHAFSSQRFRQFGIAFVMLNGLAFRPALLQAQEDPQVVLAKIRKLLPAAAAMSREDFMYLAKSPNPKFSDIKSQSLTFQLFSLAIGGDDTKEQLAELSIIAKVPKPSSLAKEVYRTALGIPVGPCTLMHEDRITDLECKVSEDGKSATGTVAFEAPKLFRGKAQFTAKKLSEKWTVTEFHLPNRKIHLVLGVDGLWHRALPPQ